MKPGARIISIVRVGLRLITGDPALVVRGREIIAPAREVILKIHHNVSRRAV